MFGRIAGRLSSCAAAVAALVVISATLPCDTLRAQGAVSPPPVVRGRITGRIVDATSGQPLAKAQVTLVGREVGAESDLDGRYTLLGVPLGRYAVRARRLGFQPKQFDSIAVTSTAATVVNFSLGAASVTLQSVVVQSTRTDQSSSESSLLAIQQKAAAVSDGISAEQMKRTPDSNAGEAATRVSGISVVDNKFVIARGLSERYSTTLVNGSEIASPEPAKRLVPLDIFPSSLLESIVVIKAATPDKPGDFSGGAVEVKTKEFPDNNVMQFSVSQSYNSKATFSTLQTPHRSGLDYLAFGIRKRPFPPALGDVVDKFEQERFLEAVRSDWNPRASRARPNLGLGLSLGGQRPSERAALGYIFSLNYSAGTEHSADRLSKFFASPVGTANKAFVYQDFKTGVDWGGVGNLALRLGTSSKLTWKNLYTRNAEEMYSTNEGFNADRAGEMRSYQFQYIERALLQTQLAGEHLLGFLASSRLEWKATMSRSKRDEPDNRQVSYTRVQGSPWQLESNSDVNFRALSDRQFAGQVDWQIPLRLLSRDISFKTGALKRAKRRVSLADLVTFTVNRGSPLPDGLDSLPPELLFTPENIGGFIGLTKPGDLAGPYDADESVTAFYAMLDFEPLPRTRLVGGVRSEDWKMDLYDGGQWIYDLGLAKLPPTLRRNKDLLWSANATVALSERMNVRLAAFTSVSRPDTRELTRDEFTDIVGNCPTRGNPTLQRSKVFNADARWEWYPRSGEVIAISGFYKDFSQPIIRTVIQSGLCGFGYLNATSAKNYGAEFDVRQNLTYLPGVLSRLSAGFNLTVVESRVMVPAAFGFDPDLALEGQSPYLGNASLSYLGDSGFSASVLYNLFGDRIARYGLVGSGVQGPNISERGRGTLDAKVQRPVGRGLTMTLSGRNLTDAPVKFIQKLNAGPVETGLARPGVTIQLGLGYAR